MNRKQRGFFMILLIYRPLALIDMYIALKIELKYLVVDATWYLQQCLPLFAHRHIFMIEEAVYN